MIEVHKTQMPAIRMTVTQSVALDLGHILDLYISEAKRGTFGGGTSVDDDIRLATEIRDALRRQLPAPVAAFQSNA